MFLIAKTGFEFCHNNAMPCTKRGYKEIAREVIFFVQQDSLIRNYVCVCGDYVQNDLQI